VTQQRARHAPAARNRGPAPAAGDTGVDTNDTCRPANANANAIAIELSPVRPDRDRRRFSLRGFGSALRLAEPLTTRKLALVLVDIGQGVNVTEGEALSSRASPGLPVIHCFLTCYVARRRSFKEAPPNLQTCPSRERR
jgi:hypothetical protein